MIILIILGLSVVELLSISFNAYCLSFDGNGTGYWFYEPNLLLAKLLGFCTLAILCKYWLKIKLHRHHYLGIGLFSLFFFDYHHFNKKR